MLTSKNRLEAFSDGVFAIVLTILILELHVPTLADSSWAEFSQAMLHLAPKFLSFLFSFFIIAIFWVNHHHLVHQIERVDARLLWLNIAALFFLCLLPFLTAFIGDYPTNPFVVALYALNMTLASNAFGIFWKYAFVDTDLAPNDLSEEQKQRRIRRDRTMILVNFSVSVLAFVWVPIALLMIMGLPLLFVVPELLPNMRKK